MSGRNRPLEDNVTLEAILKVNKDRRELLDKAQELDTKKQSLTDPAEKKVVNGQIKIIYDSVANLRTLEFDLLKQADASVVAEYNIKVAQQHHHPLYSSIASSHPSTSQASGTDSAHLAVPTPPTGAVDNSPGSGFEKFSPSFRKGSKVTSKKTKTKTANKDSDVETIDIEDSENEEQDSNMPDPTPSIVAYTPPTFTIIYNGSTNIKKFFAKYDAYASTFKWDEAMKLEQLMFHLDGAAMKCYENVKRTRKALGTLKYSEVKADMQKYFASKSSPQVYDKKLRERKLMFNENMEQYFWDVLDLVHNVDKKADLDKIRDHVLKGLPQDTAKDIWNSKPDSVETLHEKILERQRFESLMGKKVYDNNEQAINEVVVQLENMGFAVKKPANKQEVNFVSNKSSYNIV